MDTSKKYIEMCEKAKEIQKRCPFREGDYIFNKSANNGNGFLFVNYRYQPYIDKSRWEELYKREEYKEFNIWLPRQDQLQEIYGSISKGYGLTWVFAEWLRDENTTKYIVEQKFNTQEQLWLIFIMWEKYDKCWNGKEWVGK